MPAEPEVVVEVVETPSDHVWRGSTCCHITCTAAGDGDPDGLLEVVRTAYREQAAAAGKAGEVVAMDLTPLASLASGKAVAVGKVHVVKRP